MNNMPNSRRQAGFTLVELMCVVAVTGILSSVAVPSFQNALHKARRTDAQVALWQLQLAQERYRADHTSYGTTSELGVSLSSPSRQYAMSIVTVNDSGFTAQAVAVGAQASDATCRYMQLVSDGLNVTYRSGPDASASNDNTKNKQCWAI
jgi:type IV pilus assembly protein PilE